MQLCSSWEHSRERTGLARTGMCPHSMSAPHGRSKCGAQALKGKTTLQHAAARCRPTPGDGARTSGSASPAGMRLPGRPPCLLCAPGVQRARLSAWGAGAVQALQT